MLTLDNIKEWLKTLALGTDNFYVGKLDNKKDKSIGVYQLKTDAPIINLGGLEHTPYEVKRVSFLIHWNMNYEETENISMKFYKKLQNIQNIKINEIQIFLVNLLVNEPIDVGTDNKHIFERVIQAEFYYGKKGE
ncbi:MAG: hypothetical protein KIC60_06025 [Clostridium sp.]|nr:hypothetical protein [Clostridium sp.]